MIKRVIGLSFSIGLIFCLDGAHFPSINSASAAVGWTIRNGGRDAELAFAKIWQDLPRKIEICTNAFDPCNLKNKTRSLLQKLMNMKKECFPAVRVKSLSPGTLSEGACGEPFTVNSERLYRDGKAINEVEMTALALEVLQQRTCDGNLENVNFQEVAQAVNDLHHFNSFEINGSLYFVQHTHAPKGDTILVSVNAASVNVSELLRKNYPQLPENLKISGLESRVRNGHIDLHGMVQRENGQQSEFVVCLPADFDTKKALVYIQ